MICLKNTGWFFRNKKDLVRYFRNSGLSTIVFHGSLDQVQCNFVITTTSVKIGRS